MHTQVCFRSQCYRSSHHAFRRVPFFRFGFLSSLSNYYHSKFALLDFLQDFAALGLVSSTYLPRKVWTALDTHYKSIDAAFDQT